MFAALGAHYATHPSVFPGSHWHCARCRSFISLHSAEAVEDPFCPICSDEGMVFCISLDIGFERVIAEA